MMKPILKVSKKFRPIWENFIEEWKDEDLPLYILLSDLARYISNLEQNQNTDEIQMIFDIIENWHTDGDGYVKEAASVGLLEDLQNSSVVKPINPSEFIKYLGPVSKQYWDKLNDFCGNKGIITNS